MHAVVVKVRVHEFEGARKILEEQVVPRVSQAPGFVAGYWLEPQDGQGMSVSVFDSEDAARTAAGNLQPPPPELVEVESVDVREVIASA